LKLRAPLNGRELFPLVVYYRRRCAPPNPDASGLERTPPPAARAPRLAAKAKLQASAQLLGGATQLATVGLPRMTFKKHILLSFCGGVLLAILNFAILAITPTGQFANGTITPRPTWVEVIAFPLRYGARLNRRFFSPDIDNSFVLFRWSDVIASFLGAFLFFGVLTYIFLSWRSRRLRVT
jgi:hypothetical protein